jgi:hypothetical protein
MPEAGAMVKAVQEVKVDLVYPKQSPKGGLFKKVLKAGRYCSAVTNEKVI